MTNHNDAAANDKVTIQYEVFNRRGERVVKEKSFKNAAAYEKWLDANGADINVLRYEL